MLDYCAGEWRYHGPAQLGRPVSEPSNLGGSYRGGRMHFLGLGTRLGSALTVDGVLETLELAYLPLILSKGVWLGNPGSLALIVYQGAIHEVWSVVGQAAPSVVAIATFPRLCLVTDHVADGDRPTPQGFPLGLIEAVDHRYHTFRSTVGATG